MTDLKRYRARLVLLLLAAVIVGLDQWTKAWVVAHVRPGESQVLAPWLAPVFRVTFTTNTGTAFGLFQNRSTLFTLIALVVIGAIVVYVRRLPADQLAMHAILGVMLGGAIGNVVDRFHYAYVVDFVDLNFWPLIGWPVFNVADASIVFGVVALAALSLLQDWRQARAARAAPPPTSAEDGA